MLRKIDAAISNAEGNQEQCNLPYSFHLRVSQYKKGCHAKGSRGMSARETVIGIRDKIRYKMDRIFICILSPGPWPVCKDGSL